MRVSFTHYFEGGMISNGCSHGLCKFVIFLHFTFPHSSSYHSFVLYTCRYFNSLQSECFPVCFHSNANMVISAPTGSGKTVLFELCILRLLSKFISQEGGFVHLKGTLKTVSLHCKDTVEYICFRSSMDAEKSWALIPN